MVVVWANISCFSIPIAITFDATRLISYHYPMNQRLKNLDGLRAIAVLLVLFFHTSNKWPDSIGFVKTVFATGWNGVYLFFVLSGFLVGGLAIKELQKTNTINIKKFWLRRFLRTWPLYFFLLLVNILLANTDSFSPSLWHYFTFTQNFYKLDFFVPTWSLAVEEQFYFSLPLLLFFTRKLFVKNLFSSINRICVFGIIMCYVYRYIDGTSTDTFAVLDSIVIGILIANWRIHKSELFAKISKQSTAVFIFGCLFIYLPFAFEMQSIARTVLLFGFQGIGFGLIIIAALDENFILTKLLSHRFMYFIALVSYSTYLTHDRVVFRAHRWVDGLELGLWPSFFLLNTVVLIGSLVLGAFFYFTVEKAGLWLRDNVT